MYDKTVNKTCWRKDVKKGKSGEYLETVPFLSPYTDLAIIDEIGRMECLSVKFTRLVVDLLDAPVMVVATIALHGEGIIDSIKEPGRRAPLPGDEGE